MGATGFGSPLSWQQYMQMLQGSGGRGFGQPMGQQSAVPQNPGYGHVGDQAMSSGNLPAMIAGAAANVIGTGFDAASMGPVDYGKINSVEEAGQWGAQRGKAIGKGAFGIFGELFGGFIAQKLAEKRARPIIENREAKMNQIAQYQMDKLKDNAFLQNKVNGIFNQWG
jgi:hypothetical protein